MSSSSSYQPEDDEPSDSEIDNGASRAKTLPSSPPIHKLRLSSPREPDTQPPPKIHLRARRGTRAQVLHDLYTSLSRKATGDYSNLLEETVNGPVPTDLRGWTYNVTQTGAVVWTSREIDVLFEYLDRKSKNGIAEIASAIGTKSELEVQEYLKLLHKGLERQHMRERHSRTVILAEIPAATEISRSCSGALDQYAELLALEEQQSEDVSGMQKHQNLWIIDRDVAEEVNEQVQANNENSQENPSSSSVYLTAGLLNINTLIRLSERLYMNFGGSKLEDNWVNVGFAGESPSITADALADFYSLTVSVTRRLIQSTIFFAMSRLRNMRETGNTKAQAVRSCDVKTALDVLGMKRDCSDHFVGLSRRLSLDVRDVRNRKGWKSKHMDYNEVEDVLSGALPYDAESRERSISQKRSKSRASYRTASGEYMSENGESVFDNPSSESSVLSSPESSDWEEDLPEDPEVEHAEQVDRKFSALEEVQLWQLLERSPPASLESRVETKEDQKRPIGKRKTREELVDWRDRTLYRNDWEEYGYDVFDIYDDISEDRRKRRRKAPTQHDLVDVDSHDGSEGEESRSNLVKHEHEHNVETHSDDENHASGRDEGNTDDHMEIDEPGHLGYPEIESKPALQDMWPPQERKPVISRDASSERSHGSEEDNTDRDQTHIMYPEMKQEHNRHSDSEDDYLPANFRHQQSSSQGSKEDKKAGDALYSRPMSPTGWPRLEER